MRMDQRLLLGLGGMMLAVLLGAPARAEGAFKTVPAAGRVDVAIGTRSGNVQIYGWDRREVEIRSEGDQVPAVEEGNGEVRIGLGARGEVTGSADDDLTIHVPPDSRVTVSTVSGDLKVEGIQGRVKLTSVSGDIQATSCAGSVALQTVSGDIHVQNIKEGLSIQGVSSDIHGTLVEGPAVEVKTVSGDVQLVKVSVKELRLTTHSGDVLVQGSFPQDGSVKLVTFSGDATLVLPAEASFDVVAHSRSGEVSSEFDLKVSERGTGRLQGKAGAGGTDITLSSFSGELTLKKGK